jgi:Domain of unknown function (DUF4157)/LysM domain
MSTQPQTQNRATLLPSVLPVQAGLLQRQCACGQHTNGGECEACRKQNESALRRAAVNPAPVNNVSPIVHDVLNSPGQPLDADIRSFMEPRFGQDFSGVRVHTDAKAAESAQAVNALAYTVGKNVVFGAGQYAPETMTGKKLMAHELTHVVQQGQSLRSAHVAINEPGDEHEQEAEEVAAKVMTSEAETSKRLSRSFLTPPTATLLSRIGRVSSLMMQRQSVQMASGRFVGNIPGALNNLREEVLQAMDRLHLLWSITNDEYNLEYPVVSALPPGSSVPTGSIPHTIAALRRNEAPTMNPPVAQHFLNLTFSANVGRGQTNNRADIYALQDALHVDWHITNTDYSTERTAVNALATPTVPDGIIPKTIAGIAKLKASIVAGSFRRDLFLGTHAVTPTEHAQVEAILTPGATLAPGAPPVMGAPPPPPVVVPPAAMTGAGVGGPFETAMIASLKANVGRWASNFRTLKASSGQPAFPIPSASNIAVAAQQETERYFAPYIRVASRAPADIYHPGAYSLTAKLGDESARPLTGGNRAGWTGYWMTLRAGCPLPPCGQGVLDSYHVVPTRTPDSAEYTRVLNLFATDPANQTDIDDAIHSWPAEAGTGTVFIQPYVVSTPTELRRNRWDVFTTLIHEMMHILAHPNFERTALLIGGTARKYLTEGFAEVMRHELWDGRGQLKARLASPENAPLRQQVEGASYPYDPSVVKYHSDYAEYNEAKQIDAKVGHENAKAAYFLGHTELLGLGAGTQSVSPLAGVALYSGTESANADVIVAEPGDTYATIQSRTNAPAGGILDSGGVVLPVGAPIAAGTRLRVPGIRWVYAVQSDTLGSIARQHNVQLADLARANSLPPGTPETHTFAVGTRVLIPVHTPILP